MKAKIKKILNLGTFLSLKNQQNKELYYKINPPSKILLQNIHTNWLRSIYAKTHSNFPIYLNKGIDHNIQKNNICFGAIENTFQSYPEVLHVCENEDNYNIMNKSELKLTLIVPKQDVMQYFFQWQRYQKYWWSSITTTPSLFAVKDMKYGPTSIDTQIVAKFQDGEQIVENVSINTMKNISDDTASLTCKIDLETALCTLLLDGIENLTTNGYLRLHNKMAPYKISFALNCLDPNKYKDLEKLATLIYTKLNEKQISAWLPNFTLPLSNQVEENLQKGVTYTAILNDKSLVNGIFQLLSSSTMLKEQVHLADFVNYAALICSK